MAESEVHAALASPSIAQLLALEGHEGADVKVPLELLCEFVVVGVEHHSIRAVANSLTRVEQLRTEQHVFVHDGASWEPANFVEVGT